MVFKCYEIWFVLFIGPKIRPLKFSTGLRCCREPNSGKGPSDLKSFKSELWKCLVGSAKFAKSRRYVEGKLKFGQCRDLEMVSGG